MNNKLMQNKRRLATLRRYQLVMQEFNKYDCTIIPVSKIYENYIYPKFYISRTTLYRIFNTPIEKELKTLEQELTH